MQNSLVVQSGYLKGRKIPFPEPIKGQAHVTSAVLKKTVFSILESESLSGNLDKQKVVFIDLFAGSGQMGIEAYSRGFARVILVELEKTRFAKLLELVKTWNLSIELHHKDAFRILEKIHIGLDQTPVLYVDPPYSFWENEKKIFDLAKAWLEKKAKLIIQAPKKLEWENFQIRIIGKNYLITKKDS